MALVSAAACRGIGDITAPQPVEPPVAVLDVSIGQLSLAEGATASLQVTARTASAAVIANPVLFWSSSDTTVARVSAAGVVTAVRSGTATIAVSAGGRSATVRVTVAARAVASVQLTPPAPSLFVGSVVQLTARTLDDAGVALTGRPVFWSTSAATTAVVSANGLVTGIAPGVATITATSESRSAAVGVTVLPVPVGSVQITPARDTIVLGQTTQLTAAVRDSLGAALTGRVVTWSVSSAAIATVSSTGLVTGVAPGTATITATSEGRSGTATVLVEPRPVGAVIVSPTSSALIVGQTVQLNTQITDGSGNLLTGRPLAFRSSNVNVAAVSATGIVTAVAPGTATITVTSEGKTGTASVTVSASPVATLRVTPATASLIVGATVRLQASALDAGGAVLPQRPITWSSGAPTVATVTADGTVTAAGPGTALIFASAEGRLASATITVTSPAATTFAVTPQTPTIIAGQTADLTATLRDPNGVVISGRPISWLSSDPAIALVSSTGRVRAIAPGAARIDATVDGLTASAQATVIPVPVSSISLSIAAPSLLVGFTTQATATPRDSTGTPLGGRTVTWSSSAPSVASINAQGLITAVALGGATIRAVVDGVQATASVTVVTGVATTIGAQSVTTQSAAAGTSVAAPPSVRVNDAGGSPVAGVPVVFTVTGGGGGTSPVSPATVTTNTAGVATLTSWTLGTAAGPNTLTATAGTLTGSPVTFTAQGTIGTPAVIAANSATTQTATAGATVGTPPRVRVADSFGNPVAGVAVTFTVASGGGSSVPASPATVLTDAAGLAALTSWTLGGAAGGNTVTASVSGLTGSPVTFAATGTIGAATTLSAVSAVSQSATAGSAVSAPPSVKVSDANGNGVAGRVVTFAVASGGGTIAPAGPASVTTDANGVATLTSWTLGATAGSNTVTATATGLTGSPLTFTATGVVGAARTMAAVSATAQSATAGTAVSAPPSVRITDASGNPVSGVAVGFTVVAGGGTIVPASPASVNTDASGIATLTSWTLGASAGANTVTAAVGGLTGSPQTFTATGTVGAATRLGVSTQPAGAVSGAVFITQPVVQVRDANGNVVTASTAPVTVAIASGTGTLSGTTTVSAVNGVATFTNLQVVGIGAHTLTFTSAGLTGATSASFTVAPGAPTQLTLGTAPAGAVSGIALTTQPVVQLRDANGNLTTSSAAVTAAIATGTGTLSGTTTVAAVNGVATFTNLVIAGAGAHTLVFTSTGLTPVTSASVTVSQVAASLNVSTQPAGATSGAAFTTQPVVRILDNAGLVVTSGSGATLVVTAAKASGSGTLGGTLTATAVNGVATFTNLAVTGTGAHTLQFTTAAPTLAVTSGSFAVAAGAATQLALSTAPSGAVSGVAFTTQPVVEIRDAGGTLVTGSTASVTAAITTGTGTLVGTATVTAVNGVATFTNLRVDGSGAHVLTFSSTGLTSAASASFTVSQVAASLSVPTQPAGATSGAAFTTQPVVRILDNAGLVVTSGSGATLVVTAARASGSGTLGGTLTATAVNGVATFTNLAITGSGAHTLQFTTAAPALSVTSASITVTTQTATQLAITTQPAGAVSGVNLTTQPVVEIREAGGALVTGSTAAVTAAITTGTGTLVGTVTVNAVNGVATFTNLRVDGSGAHVLTFSSSGLTSAASSSITVTQVAASLSVQTQPAGATSGAAFTTQPVVRILDNAGLVVTSGSGATLVVTAAKASGSGTLGGTLTATATAGVATFTNLALTGSGAHTLQFTTAAPALSVTSASISVTTQTATQLAITTQPAGAVSGVNLTTQPVVEIRDAGGVLVSTSTAAVTAAITTGTGTLVGTATVNAVNGVATFSTLRVNGSGAHVLTFTSTGLTSAASASFTVTQVAASLNVQTQPAGATSGAAFTTQPVVRILDNAGLVVTSGSGATLVVTAAKASGTGTLGGTLTATAVAGVATFTNLTLTGTGAHTLQFTTAAPALSVTSGSVTVAAGAATQLALTTQPAGAVSGVAFTTQPVVELRDAGGSVTASTAPVTVAVGSGGGTLTGTTTVNAVNGVATFTNLTLTGSGAHTLSFASTGLTGVTSASFTLSTQPATQLAITTQPAGAVSGLNFTTQPVVEIRDAGGAVVTGSTAAVTAAITTGTGTLLGTVTVNAVNGVATFTNLRVDGSGAHVLTFTSTGLTSAASSSVTVTQVAASMSVQTQPAGATSGAAFTTQPVVRILDNAGLVVTSGSGATLVVTAAKASGSGTLGGTLTATAVAGVATFTNLAVTGAGAHTLQFTTAAPALSVTSASLTVAAGAASQLAISTQPAGAVSGATVTTQPVVELRDAGGNLTNSTAAVTVSIASGGGALTGTTTVNAVNGVATFTNLVVTGTGVHTLAFSSPGLTGVTSASFTVSAPAATQLAITTQPAGAVSGNNLTTQPVVQIRDAGGALVTGSTAAVTAAITTGTGTLVGTATVNAVNGVATFTNLRLDGSGAHVLTFSSTGLTSAASGSFTVSQVAASLSVQTPPAGATSGATFTTQPVVRILDNAGLAVTSGSGATLVVTAAKASGSGTLGGTLTATAVNGVATFSDLAITGTGAHTLSFSTTTPALTTTSASFTVTAPAATQLAITTQPAGAVSGVNLTTQPVVEIRDAGGALVSGSTAAVTAAITTGTGTLVGTATVNAVNGVATFTNLRLDGSGAHVLTFTSTGLTSAASASFTVSQVAASLSVPTQPTGATSGTAFTTQPVVRILDNAGLVVTSGSGATLVVTAAKASGSGTLGGTLTATAVAGVATFTNLAVTGTGAHTLQFTTAAPALTATSTSFTVTAPAATQLAITTQPAGAVSGLTLTTQPVVEIRDAGGALVSGSTAAVTATITTGTGTLVGTATVNAVNGVATFTNLRLDGSGAHVLTFSSSGLTSAASSSVPVTQVAASLVITTQPVGGTSGASLTTQPVIEVRDNAGRLVTTGAGATLAVTAVIRDGTGTLTNATVTASGGVATFTALTITGTGSFILRFSTTAPALTVDSASFTVNALDHP